MVMSRMCGVAILLLVPALVGAQVIPSQDVVGLWITPKLTDSRSNAVQYYRWLDSPAEVVNGRTYGLMTETKLVNDTLVAGVCSGRWTLIADSVAFVDGYRTRPLLLRREKSRLTFHARPRAGLTAEAIRAPDPALYARADSARAVPGSGLSRAAAAAAARLVGTWQARSGNGAQQGRAILRLLPNGTFTKRYENSKTDAVLGRCGTWTLAHDTLRFDQGAESWRVDRQGRAVSLVPMAPWLQSLLKLPEGSLQRRTFETEVYDRTASTEP